LIHVLAIGHWLWTRCYRLSDPVRQFSVTLISDIYCTHFTQGVVHLQLQLSLSSHFNISTDAGLFPNVSKFLAAGEYHTSKESEKRKEPVNCVNGRNNAPCHADHAKRSAHKLKISGQQNPASSTNPTCSRPSPPFRHIACTTPLINESLRPRIASDWGQLRYAFFRFISIPLILRPSFLRAPPQTTRNDIGKSMRPKPTRKDIRESIQSKPTTNDIRKITPPEDVERENNPVQPREDSYGKAHDFITRFNSWNSRKRDWSKSYLYDKKFTIPMSTKEWIKLSNELKLSESDDRSVSLLQNSSLFY